MVYLSRLLFYLNDLNDSKNNRNVPAIYRKDLNDKIRIHILKDTILDFTIEKYM